MHSHVQGVPSVGAIPLAIAYYSLYPNQYVALYGDLGTLVLLNRTPFY